METATNQENDSDINELFGQVASKLGWNSDANLDELFEQLSQSTKKKKKKKTTTCTNKKQKQKTTATKKKGCTTALTSVSQNENEHPSCNPSSTNASAHEKERLKERAGKISSELSNNHEPTSDILLALNKLHITSCDASEEFAQDIESNTLKPLDQKCGPVTGNEKELDFSASSNIVKEAVKSDDLTSSQTGEFEFTIEHHDLNDSDNHGPPDVLTDTCITKSGEINEQIPSPSTSFHHMFESEDDERITDATSNEHCDPKRNLADSKDGSCSGERKSGSLVRDALSDNSVEEEQVDLPGLVSWLLSPPKASLPSPHLSHSDVDKEEDTNKEDQTTEINFSDGDGIEVKDLPEVKVLSLTERLAQKHRKNKDAGGSDKKNRRRSCANPKSAPILLDADWVDDERIKEEEDETHTFAEEAEKENILVAQENDGTELSDGKNNIFCDKDEDQKERDLLKESFQKARTRKDPDSSSDDDFETFLSAIKTPQPKQTSDGSSSDEAVVVMDDDEFIDDTPLDSRSSDEEEDEVFYMKINNLNNPMTSGKRTKKPPPSQVSRSGSILSHVITVSDYDDEDDFVTPRTAPSIRKTKPKVTSTSSTGVKKTPAKPRRPLQPTSTSSNRSIYSTPSGGERPTPHRPPSFLASLSTPSKGQATRSRYVSDFKRNRDELTQRLFKLYNGTVFEDKLPADFSITWNNRMRKTAGFCFYKKRLSDRTARIELSVKVCDTAERLRDTLVHELCHAAAWLIHGVSDGHGKFWKYWAAKANLAHPEIPIIKRCHTYEITTKFKYKCVQCGNVIGRHSKSVDTSRFCCAYCNGRLELQPTLNKDGTPARPRGPNPFAAFVKENYASVKKTHGAAKHADVMRLLSQEFATKTKITES